jgi:predicted secreted acid phosphatase
MKQKIYFLILMSLLMTSCRSTQNTTVSSANPNDKLVMAVAWFQNSAEMTALFYQGFNIAQLRLDEAVAANTSAKVSGCGC